MNLEYLEKMKVRNLKIKNNMYNFSIVFLKFYQEFFEEDGYKWSLKEINDKLIEDKIIEYKINNN